MNDILEKANNDDKNIPLCVDLDGTLLSSDTLLESCLIAIKQKPYLLVLFAVWIPKGKFFFKEKVHQIAEPAYDTLLYRDDVLEFIEIEKNAGREIVLATASSQNIAERIADDLGIFDLVLGSGNGINLRSKYKRDELVRRYGEYGYDYIGDSEADIAVFEKARYSYLVEPNSSVRKKADAIGNVKKEFGAKASKVALLIKQIRVYQWVKNILIFLPLLLAHILPVGDYLTNTLLAFISFSLIASSVYVLNDLLDLPSDRVHPRKKTRPFASGHLSLKYGFMLFPLLLVLGFIPSFLFLSTEFNLILLFYFLLTSFYSFIIKRIYILDILVLASLYTIRLLVGAMAVDVPASPWLLSFSMFIFLSLACVKRYTELFELLQKNLEKTAGRGYTTSDIGLIKILGVTNGLLSILVFILYVNSKEIIALYNTPLLLYSVAFLFLYWILRVWFKTVRGEMHDDPIVFTGKDKPSMFIFILIVLLVIGATI